MEGKPIVRGIPRGDQYHRRAIDPNDPCSLQFCGVIAVFRPIGFDSVVSAKIDPLKIPTGLQKRNDSLSIRV
jgi:hypothetical protein